jgi:diguanylate cyclase (GGDEF)-like protein
MGDIEEPGSIPAVAAPDPREKQEQQDRQRGAEDDEAVKDAPSRQRNIADVAFIMGIPAAELTAKVQEALSIIMAEFDRLRGELDHTKEHAHYLEELADRHPFLPVMSRRALLRELSRALTRAERTETNSSFLYLDIANSEDIKRALGRAAAEAALAHAAAVLGEALRGSDFVGGLEGNDLGIILTVTEGAAAAEKAQELVAALARRPFEWQGRTIRLAVAWGLHPFAAGESVDDVLDAADRDRRARDAGPGEAGV